MKSAILSFIIPAGAGNKITSFLRFPAMILLFSIAGNSVDLVAQRISRDLNVGLFINQAGYIPEASKVFTVKGNLTGNFDVISLETGVKAFSGVMKYDPGDFGDYSAGDFSALRKEGYYYVKADTIRSYPFRISGSTYNDAMSLIVKYFSVQRCGSSTTGYLSPCHTDDGIRMDNGKHQDVSGGWHDASDLRKWVGATIYGMIGLSRTYELMGETNTLSSKIMDELRWGNQYFLKMQEPEGYVMNYVGGDVKKHSDSNRWTDNEPGPEGGELRFTKPTAGRSNADMLIFGSNDDRVIRTDPVDMIAQYNFVVSEAVMSRITRTTDRAYSDICLEAAEKCFGWCKVSNRQKDPGTTGASIQAAIEMYKTTGNDSYRDFAVEKARDLQKLQASAENDAPGGFFYSSDQRNEPYKDIWHGCLEFISVCDLAEAFPGHGDSGLWRSMIENYSRYLLFMSGKNSFGIVPYGLFSEKDPGGNRKTGRYWYRYFMQPELDWWVGINSNLASAGVGLMKASSVLKDNELKAAAQRQLDWIIGRNPFNSSTLTGIGYNHPRHFPGSTFLPNTPVIPGAVLNGLGGDKSDQPDIGSGNWQISEYWTPMVAYTLWLLAELSGSE